MGIPRKLCRPAASSTGLTRVLEHLGKSLAIEDCSYGSKHNLIDAAVDYKRLCPKKVVVLDRDPEG